MYNYQPKYKDAEVSDLIGHTLSSIEKHSDSDEAYDKLIFITVTGERYEMYHRQDCCESVFIEDITGDLSDLLGEPIFMAEESSNEDQIVGTWTFYKFATIRGYVDLRWLGTSNGYYSEKVKFIKLL